MVPGCSYAVFFLIGCGFLALMVGMVVWPEIRANNFFVPQTCVVLGKRIVESPDADGATYRAEFLVRYSAAGRDYQSWTYDVGRISSGNRERKQKILDQFAVGRRYPCWYDPDDPAKVTIVLGYSWFFYLFLLIPLVFIAIGWAGMRKAFSARGKSPERRAADRLLRPGAAEGSGPGPDLPNVPRIDLADSPGTTLKYRLPIGMSPGRAVLGILFFSLFWNGITSIFVVMAVRGHLQGNASWFLTVLLIPFVLVGLGTIVFFVRQLLVALGVGPTVVEVSAHPLMPGGRDEVSISQSGRLTMNALVVTLVCEESATYRQGTDTRTETRKVREIEVFRHEGFEIEDGLPFEARASLTVPPGAMHSFKASHNEVRWRLVVAGDVANWPDFSREFPLIVHPATDPGGPR